MTRLSAVLIAVALLGLTHWQAYRSGAESVKAENREAVAVLDARVQALTAELAQTQTRRSVVYRDRIQVIRNETDDCMGSPLPVAVLEQLRAGDPIPP